MISRLIITTKDRPELVQRAIDSFGSTGLPITVYDQSATRHDYTGLARLVGPPEVETMIDRLATKGFDRELLQWGLVGGHGGYRNVAMLDTVGEVALSTDDDTACQFIGVLDQEEGFRYGNPEPYWRLFASRAEWEKWTLNLPRTTDVVAEHEKYIGQKTSDGFTFCIAAAGLVGDSASSFNTNILAQNEAHRRLMANYDALKNTREVMQVVPRATMCPGSKFLRTMNYSFDNRVELPPFPPNGRGECGVFASVLSLVKRTAVVYLPWGIVHTPPEGREWSPTFGPLQFDEAFYCLLAASGATTMNELGEALANFGTLKTEQAHEMLSAHRVGMGESTRTGIRKVMEQGGSDEWIADCEKVIAESEAAGMVTLEDSSRMQQELIMYGKLLLAWPSLREAAA